MSYLINKENITNYVHNVDTSFVKEGISTTIEYYPGTEVTYTPTTSASKVIYECNFQTAWNPDGVSSLLCSRLQYSTDGGSSWTDINGTKSLCGNSSSVLDHNWITYFMIFTIDSWAGERKIRLAGRSYSTATEFTIGRSYDWSEGVGSCPHVSIYSVK
tara:strand:- start:11684 stop:12160 length:477 start_codon:yes stop_codon:yes gene_type:complete